MVHGSPKHGMVHCSTKHGMVHGSPNTLWSIVPTLYPKNWSQNDPAEVNRESENTLRHEPIDAHLRLFRPLTTPSRGCSSILQQAGYSGTETCFVTLPPKVHPTPPQPQVKSGKSAVSLCPGCNLISVSMWGFPTTPRPFLIFRYVSCSSPLLFPVCVWVGGERGGGGGISV